MRMLAAALFAFSGLANAQPLPIFDAHVHYSHDAWDLVPVQDAIAILRKAGVKRALISSSGDDGLQPAQHVHVHDTGFDVVHAAVSAVI